MGHSSLSRSPKREEQEVPDSTNLQLSVIENACGEKEIRAVDDLEAFWGPENEGNLPEEGKSLCARLTWDFMHWEGFPLGGEEEESDDQKAEKTGTIFVDEGRCSTVKRENYYYGFWDGEYEERKASLNLNLNYQQVLDAWSDRGSLWADEYSLSKANNSYVGEVPMMEEERTRREASVLRYKEKRQARLFSKKIRYQVRKLNADKRPRLKGRFVRRSPMRSLIHGGQ